MVEHYLTQQGYISKGIDETEQKEVYSVFEKDKDLVELYHDAIYDRPTVRSILKPIGLSLEDFESFVYDTKMTEEAYKIIDDCIDTPSEDVKREAKKWLDKNNTEQ